MKTKLLALAICACIVFCTLCSCGTGNTTATTATTGTTSISPPDYGLIDIDPTYIYSLSVNDFAKITRSSQTTTAQAIRNAGKLYYPVQVSNEYEFSCVNGRQFRNDCYIVNYEFKAVVDNPIYGKHIGLLVFYGNYTLNDDLWLTKIEGNEYEIFEDGSFYVKKYSEFHFLYNGHVCCTYFDKINAIDGSHLQNIFEIKSIDITE